MPIFPEMFSEIANDETARKIVQAGHFRQYRPSGVAECFALHRCLNRSCEDSPETSRARLAVPHSVLNRLLKDGTAALEILFSLGKGFTVVMGRLQPFDNLLKGHLS
jgi:hypothetical protein